MVLRRLDSRLEERYSVNKNYRDKTFRKMLNVEKQLVGLRGVLKTEQLLYEASPCRETL